MRSEEVTPKTLPELLVAANKSHWCEEFKLPSEKLQQNEVIVKSSNNTSRMIVLPEDQQYFQNWNYVLNVL